jgi:hypothetical protein
MAWNQISMMAPDENMGEPDEKTEAPPPVKRRPGRRSHRADPSLRALRRFTLAIEPLPKHERDALIRWLVDRYEVQTSPLTWRR